MKKIVACLSVFLAVGMIAAVPLTVGFAAPLHQAAEPTALERVAQILIAFGSLAGFASLISTLVNLGKSLHWFGDGQAPAIFAGVTLAAVIFLTVTSFVKPEWSMQFLDVQAGLLAGIVTFVGGYIVQLASGFVTHNLLADYHIPWFGASYSRQTVPGVAFKRK